MLRRTRLTRSAFVLTARVVLRQLGAALAIFAGDTSLAAACGAGMVIIMLFRAYPEAKTAWDAEDAAMASGLVSSKVWSPETGRTIHMW